MTPEVIRREVADKTLTLTFGTVDSVQMLQGGIWSVEIIVACLIVGFLLSAISGWICLGGERLFVWHEKRRKVAYAKNKARL